MTLRSWWLTSRAFPMFRICRSSDLLFIRTSGLDASIALGVMHVLRDIAATGRTVIGMRPNFTWMYQKLSIRQSYYSSTTQ